MQPRSLRLPGEQNQDFQARAETAAKIARLLVDAALSNICIQDYIEDPDLPQWTELGQRRSPVVRVEFEQAIAIGSLGETLCATRNKHWGDGPQVLPLEPDDFVYPRNLTYVFRENSLYNRRFEQRAKIKVLLGKKHRQLASSARQLGQNDFLDQLSSEQSFLIRKGLKISPQLFWRVVNGKEFIELPEKMHYVSPVLLAQVPKKKQQQSLRFDP